MDPIRYVCRRQHADRMDQTIGEKQSPQCIQKNESRLLTCAFVPMVTHKNPSQVRSHIYPTVKINENPSCCVRENDFNVNDKTCYIIPIAMIVNLILSLPFLCRVVFLSFFLSIFILSYFFHSLSITISRQYNSTKHKKMNWEIFSHVASSVHSRR